MSSILGTCRFKINVPYFLQVVASSLRIVVLDVDEAPRDMELSATTILENSPVNAMIGKIGFEYLH